MAIINDFGDGVTAEAVNVGTPDEYHCVFYDGERDGTVVFCGVSGGKRHYRFTNPEPGKLWSDETYTSIEEAVRACVFIGR